MTWIVEMWFNIPTPHPCGWYRVANARWTLPQPAVGLHHTVFNCNRKYLIQFLIFPSLVRKALDWDEKTHEKYIANGVRLTLTKIIFYFIHIFILLKEFIYRIFHFHCIFYLIIYILHKYITTFIIITLLSISFLLLTWLFLWLLSFLLF